MVWNELIACYLFLAGLGAGSFVYASWVGWKAPEASKSKIAALCLAIVAVGIGTLLLMVDAKAGFQNPMRFFYLLSNWSSVMLWGVALLSAFLIIAFVELVILIKTKKTPKALDGVGVVLAVGVALYTGLLLGAAPSYPLWNIVILPLLFLVSAASTGFAAARLCSKAAAHSEKGSELLPKKIIAFLPVVEAVLVIALLAVTALTPGVGAIAGSATIAALTVGAFAPAFWVGLWAVGLIVPAVIELYGLKKEWSAGVVITSEICILVGGFMLRYLVIMAAVPLVA